MMNHPIRLSDITPSERDRDEAKKLAMAGYIEQIQFGDVLEAIAEHIPETHQSVMLDRLRTMLGGSDPSGFDPLVVGTFIGLAVRNYVERMVEDEMVGFEDRYAESMFEELRERGNLMDRSAA